MENKALNYMTKRERVLNAFNNKEVDHVPMAFWYHFSPDEDLGQETIDADISIILIRELRRLIRRMTGLI